MLRFLPILLLTACTPKLAVVNPTETARDVQAELNATHLDPDKSILTDLQRSSLEAAGGLPFYAVDESYAVPATLTVNPDPETISIPTSAGRDQVYDVYGTLDFVLQGKPQKLNVYRSKRTMKMPGYADYLFLPFRDETSGEETYGGGRYLDVRIPKEGNTILLDFNRAYHPYCAYRSGYACPIPPAGSTLNIAVEAGIKMTEAVVFE